MARKGEGAGALAEIYATLATAYGPRHWWPAETPFEMAIGAILTQNTAWSNVERAIAALREAKALSRDGLAALDDGTLQSLIRPTGFFRQKAERLQGFAAYLQFHHAGVLERMLAGELSAVRKEMLAIKGIGPETADSILLYAGGHATFVVDAYTRRLMSRLGLLEGKEPYETIRTFFQEHLPASAPLFNEYHALIVEHCKQRCRKNRPVCSDCPLAANCLVVSRESPPPRS
jgi:endonuclease-3 related protein